MIEIVDYTPDNAKFLAIKKRGQNNQSLEVATAVRQIIDAVRQEGDAALCRFSEEFDQIKLTPATLTVSEGEFAAAQAAVSEDFLTAVTMARVNIRRFHEYQRRSGYLHDDGDNVHLAKRVLPLKRVGIYCPAGSAPLFSTLLMCAVPAQIAGVEEIVVCASPQADGKIAPHILTVARLLGLKTVYKIGGAHAIAALAWGTETIKQVDKIAGPGGPYVNEAKRQCFGAAGIDALAGPSELVIVADQTARARFVAADLLSQLEHGSGEEAAALFTDSADLAAGVKIEIKKQLPRLSRQDLIARALEKHAAIFLVPNLDAGIAAANALAPEHLEIIAEDEDELLGEVENAGAVFLGNYSPEAVGDYFAGSNHVLPTAGAARFMSSLSGGDFVKDISVIRYSAARLERTGQHIANLANLEGLSAHAASVAVRLEHTD